ncbi:MAG TPA: universal stress protein [Ramlibacter sp.]|nr:universal stress protein [Ramlibacter sp.]
MFKNILLATDGSAASTHAAQLAVGLARTHGARLTALYVVDPYVSLGAGEANALGYQAYMSAALQLAAEAHEHVMKLCAEGDPVEFHRRVAQEVSAPTGIVQVAREAGADLIVVGSHGRTGVARLVLGSVAGKVVAESPIPVLVAR